MISKLCKKIFMVIFCLCYGSCWLDGNVSCSGLSDEEIEELERQRKEIEKFISNLAPCVDGEVKIGTQVWQKCNLNVKPSTGNSSCYKNDPANCEKFGRLYDWSTAMALPDSCNSSKCASQINAEHKGLCPSGWHIPSDADWSALINYVESEKGCTECAGKYLKVKGWSYGKGDAFDSYGFSALPGGYYSDYSVKGSFSSVGDYGNWWSASEYGSEYGSGGAYIVSMDYHDYVSYTNNSKGLRLCSVRCVQD